MPTAINAAKATSASGRRDRQNDIRLRNMDASASRRSAVDEQAAFAHDGFAVAQTFDDLDHLSVSEAGLYVTPFDRFVLACDPDVSDFAIVDNCVLWHCQRVISFASEDGHARKHFRTKQMPRIVNRRPHQQASCSGIERGRDKSNICREYAVRVS